jgi:hypothetical protein
LQVISVEVREPGGFTFTSASAARDLAPLASGGAPVPVSMSRDIASHCSNYSAKGNRVEAGRDLVFRQREIPEDLLPDYRAFRHAARADEAQLVSMEVSPAPEASAPAEPKRDSPQ